MAKPSSGLSSKQRSNIAKRAHEGKNIGHGNFNSIAEKAAKEYGSEAAGRRVAAAAMWKNVDRHKTRTK